MWATGGDIGSTSGRGTVLTPPPARPPPLPRQEHTLEGVRLNHLGQYAAAIQQYERALQLTAG